MVKCLGKVWEGFWKYNGTAWEMNWIFWTVLDHFVQHAAMMTPARGQQECTALVRVYNQSHDEMIHYMQSIGIHDCASRDERAGVICPEMASFPTTTISPSGSSLSYTLQTTEPSMTTAQPSNHSTESLQIILLAVMSGVLALAVIAVICILCLIGVMRARKGKSETKLGGKKKT